MNVLRCGCRLCLLALMLLVATAVGCEHKHPPVVATPPPIVQVSQAVARPVTDYQIFTARTQAVESVDIKARVTGFLTKIHFQDGGEVKKDQVLFEIDDRPYKASLDAAKAQLEFSQAALVKNKADYDIGLAVQKQNKGAISEQEIDKRRGSWEESKAGVDKAKASLESAQLYYDWCKVTSPLDGRANRHFVDVGALVSQDTTVLTNVVSLKPTWAYFDVDENTLLRVQKLVAEGKVKGVRESTITVGMALGGDKGYPIQGTIDFLSNQVDPNTGSLRVRAVFPNDDGNLAAGLFGRIRVPIGQEHPALLVNDQAIGTNQGQKFVLVVNEKDEVEYHPVEVGQLHDGLREVMPSITVTEPGKDGKDTTKQLRVLGPNDRIIVDGLQRVRPGMKVDPRPVDMLTLMNAPGGATPKVMPPKDGKGK
ncbi:MAG: efflux RND transporter periplasmic adaptor subunit [Planctomycetia bacterium]|nr:efflux RND transporter periplasmic adaptor subunit [Planctomycetia bacterium]